MRRRRAVRNVAFDHSNERKATLAGCDVAPGRLLVPSIAQRPDLLRRGVSRQHLEAIKHETGAGQRAARRTSVRSCMAWSSSKSVYARNESRAE
jgi:hypothetical protein